MVLAILVGQSANVRAEVTELAPASAWAMDYADDSCALRREFGIGEGRVILEMEQFAPGSDDIQFSLVGPSLELRNNWLRNRPTLRFLPDAEGAEVGAPMGITAGEAWHGITFVSAFTALAAQQSGLREGPLREYLATIDRPTREAATTALELTHAFTGDLRLRTGNMGPPMAAMRTCLEELLTHWGIDAEAHRNLQRKVEPLDMSAWARDVQEVYPPTMIRDSQQAVLRIRLDVSTEGRTTGCHMQTRMGQEQFERTACDILRGRARFNPALDAGGNPVASFYVLAIFYALG